MKRLFSLLLSCALMLCLCLPARGVETLTIVEGLVDGVPMAVTAELYNNGTSYFPLEETVKIFYPEAVVLEQDGIYTAKRTDFTLSAQCGSSYFQVNDRYIYVGEPLKKRNDGMVMIPARLLGRALGFSVAWDGRVLFTSDGEPLSANDKPYTDDELDLISRVIMHESGNQPLEGKMAVGNVILNRVANSSFPNSVYDVIYQKNQFPGATNATPNAESLIAAKLVLEGANVVPGAYWFNGVGKSCWASRNKTLLSTIGGHAFYG